MKNNNQINVPQAREAMDRFKMQAAQEVGVNLTNGYNGHLTSREAGSVGGQMVKNNCPIRTITFLRTNRVAQGHQIAIRYIAHIGIYRLAVVSGYIYVFGLEFHKPLDVAEQLGGACALDGWQHLERKGCFVATV